MKQRLRKQMQYHAAREAVGSRPHRGPCAAMILCTIALASGSVANGQEWKRPDSPFVIGEAYPDVVATCETANYWINHAPQIDDRIRSCWTRALLRSVTSNPFLNVSRGPLREYPTHLTNSG